MLKVGWYFESPIDFEHKNYLLLDYLSKVDNSFSEHKLSPYLLWTEKLIKDLSNFRTDLLLFNKSLKRDIIGFDWINGIKYSDIENPKELEEIYDIISYSKPILEAKVKIGYILFKKYPQILY